MKDLNAMVVTSGATNEESDGSFLDRRQEVRVHESNVCAYGLCESIEGERMVIEQGEVYSLDRSEHGILVLMGSQPRNRQLLELHVPQTRWEYALNLYEVRWTKRLPVESRGNLFLVGCRLLLGASRYWAFLPKPTKVRRIRSQVRTHEPTFLAHH
ncbi:MAG TPA: hypothetical protein PKD12_00655 [Nitrospira sp.]|nr:hypothetical protein [Nitrospira sp.]